MERHRHVSIDYYAYQSGLKEWNASYKVIFAMSALVLVIAVNSMLLSIVTMVFMGSVSCFVGKVRLSDYFRLLLVPIMFILMSGLAILIQFGAGEGSLLCVPFLTTNFYISQESIMQAVSLSCKAMGAVSSLFLLTLSTPMGEIIPVFRKIHVPGMILELMHFIYRYIFILLEVNHRQKDAIRSRLGYQDRKNALRVFGCEMANLLVVSMNKAQNYYDALESRGYEGDCLFWEEERKLTVSQFLWGILYVLLALFTLMVSLQTGA